MEAKSIARMENHDIVAGTIRELGLCSHYYLLFSAKELELCREVGSGAGNFDDWLASRKWGGGF